MEIEKHVVMFTTPTCGACKTIKSYLPNIDITIEEIILDNNTRDQFAKNNVLSSPTLLFYKDNQIVYRHEGFITQEKLMELYNG